MQKEIAGVVVLTNQGIDDDNSEYPPIKFSH